MLLNREIFASMGADLFHSVTAGQILGWGCIIFFAAWPTYMLLVTSKGTKSYCDVYEEAVVGVTAFNPSNQSAAMQHFELPYAQIINVTESKYNLTFYTNHGSYEVMALKKRREAMQEIRARMNGGQK